MQKFFVLSVFLFIPLIAILFVQCNEPVIEPTDQDMVLSLNKGEGEVPVGNNFSFPAYLADGYSIPAITATNFGTAFTYDDPSTVDVEDCSFYEFKEVDCEYVASDEWYAQKVDGNVWQADYVLLTPGQNVSFIDWGDNIESVNPKIDRPFRLEVTLYKNVASENLNGYTMTVLANPSSPDEIQGTNGDKYHGIWATVASPKGKIAVQKWSDDNTVPENWDGTKWTDAVAPDLSFGFAVELNVGGKLIFGASKGGWVPTVLGKYRLTFYLAEGSDIDLQGAGVGNYGGNVEDVTPSESLNVPVVDAIRNITYVDVTVAEAGSGGKK
ncbi:MAG: hypothetical protein MUO34_11725 [Ignavibacteriaceae bacterium]|nr:hypothetical protein [Ignavibacteriaceae bacterium]